MAAKKEALSNALLNAVLRNVTYTSSTSVFVALFTVAPTATTAGTEVTGGSYARQAVTFSAASAGATSNSSPVTFPVATAAWGTVVAAAVMDAASAGNQLYFGNLATSKTVGTGDQLNFAASSLACTEN